MALDYYPINDYTNTSILEHYNKMKKAMPNVIFGGRLAEYRYYDMHQVIASALQAVKSEFKNQSITRELYPQTN